MKTRKYICDVCRKELRQHAVAIVTITRQGYNMRNAAPGRIEYEYHACNDECTDLILKVFKHRSKDERDHQT